MKKIKPFLGYIPSAIIIIPFAIALIYQGFFYRGCMDGFQYFFTAMIAFLIGGVFNFAFLLYVLMKKDKYLSFCERWKNRLAKGGLVTSVVILIFQLCVLIFMIRDML